MKTKITDSHIRAYLLEDPRNTRATIQRNGHVIVTTTRTRGDGGRTPWRMFVGMRSDLACDVADALHQPQ